MNKVRIIAWNVGGELAPTATEIGRERESARDATDTPDASSDSL